MTSVVYFDMGERSTAYSGFSLFTILKGIAQSFNLVVDEKPIQEKSLVKFSYKGIQTSPFPSIIIDKKATALEAAKVQDDYFAKLLEAADRADKSIAIPKNQTIDEFVNFINAL